MTPEFLKLVAKMRDYQRQYFEARQKNMHKTGVELLRLAKAAEREVDRMLAEMTGDTELKNQIKMF